MKVIAIIPARGGSKRLPRKNILPLQGEPLVSRVVRAAIKSECFHDVVVSTEDAEIANIVEGSGATVHVRPEFLARDDSTVTEVCLDVLDKSNAELFCCIYATAALLSHSTLRESSQIIMHSQNIDVLMGVSEYQYSPFQALIIDNQGRAKLLHPEYNKTRSQHYPKVRVSNGTFYWARVPSFRQEQTFYSRRLGAFDVPEGEVCDIDTEKDFTRMCRLFAQR